MGKFEKKFGRFSIKNLSLYLIICYAFGYILQLVNVGFLQYLTLNPYFILRGQVWRVISWILVPPSGENILLVAIMLFFYYSIGNTLEHTWGTYRFNLYIFGGILFTVLAAFGLYFYFEVSSGFRFTEVLNQNVRFAFDASGMRINASLNPADAAEVIAAVNRVQIFNLFTTYYINMSIFLAFAVTYPDMPVLLMFILPVRVKWLGLVYGILILYDVFGNGVGAILPMSFVVGGSLLNFLVFFLFFRKKIRVSREQILRRRAYEQQIRNARRPGEEANAQGSATNRAGAYGGTGYGPQHMRSANITRHKCAICGRSEADDAELEFRFCSKCNGNYEYCSEHLWTHTHVQ